ncbi:hypothetical protein ACWF94_14070 [Streptomyces sp. NPDC055078]
MPVAPGWSSAYARTVCVTCREQRGLVALADVVRGEALWSV